ncbi:unnamed protein product [Diabrotica balteata]|uniref:Uncharacterized protein n=1 Tax=Diabrotica balteata TaxID=107213 RepID=A0A9N9XCU9_DIABA|nr:unnamed protein product [Diabrotica balteata]
MTVKRALCIRSSDKVTKMKTMNIATDNNNNKPGTSLLQVDLLPERKDELQISDFLSDNDHDSKKIQTMNQILVALVRLPLLHQVIVLAQAVADTALAEFQAVNTPAASIQVPDVQVADTIAANLQGSGSEVSNTQLADIRPANTHLADTKIASPKKGRKNRVAVIEN